MEYDVVQLVEQALPALHSTDEAQTDVHGYIIIVSGTSPFQAGHTVPFALASHGIPAYSRPVFGVANLGISPDG